MHPHFHRIDSYVEILPDDRARVESGQVLLDVSLQLVDDVSVGDYVIVHVGFALEVLDVAAAQETLHLLEQMAISEQGSSDGPQPQVTTP